MVIIVLDVTVHVYLCFLKAAKKRSLDYHKETGEQNTACYYNYLIFVVYIFLPFLLVFFFISFFFFLGRGLSRSYINSIDVKSSM